MSLNECADILESAYIRAEHAARPGEMPGIRRAFRRALAAASSGDPKPTILLSYRWP